MKKLFGALAGAAALLVCAWAVLDPTPAYATCTGGNLQVETTGTVSGLANNQRINTIAGNLATFIESGTAPTTTSTCLASMAGVAWHDTANNLLKIRNQADSAWITVGKFDETNGAWVPYQGGPEQTIASAATVDLGSVAEQNVVVSGTTTITSFGSSASTASPYYFVRFSGALTLTYNATSLILPGAANITTAAGDWLIAKYEGSGNWRVVSYTRTSVTPYGAASIPNHVWITTSQTYTPTSGLVWAEVWATGGGNSGGAGSGGGGGGGGGGGAGGTAHKVLSAATIGASQTVTIGGAGGGNTTFGALLTGNGGTAGSGNGGGVGGGTGGAGGGASGGTQNIGGGAGGGGSVGISGTANGPGGVGGSSMWGGPGACGSGGTGGEAGGGAAGIAGCVLVIEHFSD